MLFYFLYELDSTTLANNVLIRYGYFYLIIFSKNKYKLDIDQMR